MLPAQGPSLSYIFLLSKGRVQQMTLTSAQRPHIQEPLERMSSDPILVRRMSMGYWIRKEGCSHMKGEFRQRASGCQQNNLLSVSCTECIKSSQSGVIHLMEDLKRLKIRNALCASIDREGNLQMKGSHEVYLASHTLLESSIDCNGIFKHKGESKLVLNFQTGWIL